MWTLPNILTGLRLLTVPVLGWVLLTAGDAESGRIVALALFVAASLTDVADGWIARRRGQCSEFGALMDPIADKALVATALVCLSLLQFVPWWVTIVVLAREVIVTGVRLTVLHHGVIPASRGGKVKTATQTALVVLALAAPQQTDLLTVAAVMAVLWTVVTGFDYGAKAAALARPEALRARPVASASDRRPVDSRP